MFSIRYLLQDELGFFIFPWDTIYVIIRKNYCTLLTHTHKKKIKEWPWAEQGSHSRNTLTHFLFFSYFILPENIREPIDFVFSTRIKWESLEKTFHRTNEKRKTKPIFKNNVLYLQLRSQSPLHLQQFCAWKVCFYTSATSSATFLWTAFTLNQLPLDASRSSVHNGL